MTSFLSSNVTPALNGYHDWMDVNCDNLLVGSGQIDMYSVDSKLPVAKNTLKATNGGTKLKWVNNVGVETILADTLNPPEQLPFYAGFQAKGVNQPLIFPAPASTVVVDPAKSGESQNKFGKLPDNTIEYVGNANTAFMFNITGYFSITGGAGILQNISFELFNGVNSLSYTDCICIDNGTQIVNFALAGFSVCNPADIITLKAGSNNPVTVDLGGLHVNISQV